MLPSAFHHEERFRFPEAFVTMTFAEPTKVGIVGKVRCTVFFLFAMFYVSSGLLTSVCSAQQTNELIPDTENKQLLVNWLYGAYVPKDVPLTPMTLQNRLKLYERQLSITHKLSTDHSPQFNIGEAGQSSPHHEIAGRRIGGSGEIAAQPCEFYKVNRECVTVHTDIAVFHQHIEQA
jgi:hypothetical protein